MESSTSRPKPQNSPTLSFFVSHGWFQSAFHLLWTTLEVQCRRECVMSLVVGQRSGVRSVADFGRCISQHREESKPIHVSSNGLYHSETKSQSITHSHSSI